MMLSSSNLPPLLRLPLEIRRLIYSYLIPNADLNPQSFISGPTREASTKYRKDGQLCHPKILRVNRQIHHEAIEEFYGHASFCMSIPPRPFNMGYTFLTKSYSYNERPPTTFSYVKRLTLRIRVQRVLNESSSQQLARIFHSLFAVGRNRLEHLQIILAPSQNEFQDAGDLFVQALETYLGSLRRIRGIPFVEIEANFFFKMGARQSRDREETAAKLASLEGLTTEYFRELERVMMLPAGSEDVGRVCD